MFRQFGNVGSSSTFRRQRRTTLTGLAKITKGSPLPSVLGSMYLPQTGYIKVWDGNTWVKKPVKVWNGSSWVIKPLKVWNGSSWNYL